MHDTDNTVITEITTSINKAGDFDTAKSEYFYYIEINGATLKYYGDLKYTKSQQDFNKLISKGARKEWRPLPTSEEDQGWADGTAADCANPKMHGHVVMTTLAGADSGQLVWDYYKQKCVDKKDLTGFRCDSCYHHYRDGQECSSPEDCHGGSQYKFSGKAEPTVVPEQTMTVRTSLKASISGARLLADGEQTDEYKRITKELLTYAGYLVKNFIDLDIKMPMSHFSELYKQANKK